MSACPIYAAIERAARARDITRLGAHILHKLRSWNGDLTPSHAQLAHAAACSKSTVKRAMKKAVALGLVTQQARFVVGVGVRARISNRYSFSRKPLESLILKCAPLVAPPSAGPASDALATASRARALAAWNARRTGMVR